MKHPDRSPERRPAAARYATVTLAILALFAAGSVIRCVSEPDADSGAGAPRLTDESPPGHHPGRRADDDASASAASMAIVCDPVGAPLPTARVTLRSATGAVLIDAVSDRNGRIAVPMVAADGSRRRLSVTASRFESQSITLEPGARLPSLVRLRRSASLNLHFGPSAAIDDGTRVLVFDARERRRTPMRSAASPLMELEIQAGQATHTIEDLPLDRALTVVVRSPRGYSANEEVNPLSSGEARRADLVLECESGIVGSFGVPAVPDLVVCVDVLSVVNGGRTQVERTIVRGGGREFRVRPLSPGAYLLQVSARSGDTFWVASSTRATVRTSEVTDVGTIRAADTTVRFLVDPPPGGSAAAASSGSEIDLLIHSFGSRNLASDYELAQMLVPLGRPFTVHGLGTGRTDLEFTLLGASGAPDAELGFAKRTMTVGEGADDCRVELMRRDRAALGSVTASARSQAPGGLGRLRFVILRDGVVLKAMPRMPSGLSKFSSRSLEPGMYLIEVFGAGLRGARSCEVVAGKLTEVEVTLDSGAATAAGRVEGADGAVAPGVIVALAQRVDDSVREIDQVVSADDGSFRFDALPQIDGLCLVARADRRSALIDLGASGSDHVTLRLR